MKTPVTQAIIPVAGMGTRFFPATKSVPKEMFPVFDTPVIQLIVEEAVSAGIQKIVFVISEGKEVIRTHFSGHEVLESLLRARGKKKELELIQDIADMAEFEFVFQDRPLGDGHAILCAEEVIDPTQPCVVLFGDDLVDNPTGKNAVEQLLHVYQQESAPVVLLESVPYEEVHKYGIVAPHTQKGTAVHVASVVEKPEASEAPSNLGIVGKYVITPEVFQQLKTIQGSETQEIRLSAAFTKHVESGGALYGKVLEGIRFDTGDKAGFTKATVHYARKSGVDV